MGSNSSTRLTYCFHYSSWKSYSWIVQTGKIKVQTKSSQLLMLAQQLIAQASQEDDDNSSDESAASNPYGSAFQDAQDPFA
ncbi:hypothetical protein RHMOL_Rhmol04G0236800 [Rhododendron molle]|uniref:Uncharacterized protein n=1 Tax=Rhododendron molle TaxID=49168 RepID=A0ACC0P4X3_RHOML|nr:hypothetical protein RHMOL_Rhmol04G0236800 [Rhododendron molle]